MTPPIDPATVRGALLALASGAYATCQLGLLVYAGHRWTLLVGRRVPPASPPVNSAAEPPHVTVQLPVFNEPHVVERLVAAAGALEWPRERLEVQVLDDSTDATVALAAAAVARLVAAGIDAVHLRRDTRAGAKAGALAAGLAVARGELVAIFDADFVPPPDTLRRLVPYFADPRIGMVQARWGHLNRGASWLTAAQATLLDAHFLLEHAARAARGRFFNFNGTAGIWRRRCIEDAGGWSSATLTEDLDLSYRAQLAGWRFAFAPDVVVPAELPSDMNAFLAQQRRWTRGSIQTARRVLPGLLASPLPWRVRAEALVHLTANASWPLLLALAALLPPTLLVRPAWPPALAWSLFAATVLLGALPVALFLAAGSRAAGRRGFAPLADALAAMTLGAGLSLNNALAALAGLTGDVGAWERTPKTGERDGAPVASARRPAFAPTPVASALLARASAARRGAGELALALAFALVLAWAAAAGAWRALPFLATLVAGFAWVASGRVAANGTARRANATGRREAVPDACATAARPCSNAGP